MAAEGELALTGELPIMTMGGLKARGNPIGATGVYQMVEAVQQLRGTGRARTRSRSPPRPGAKPGRPGCHCGHPRVGANLIGF